MTEDRISALPDDLLVTILLLIPTKEAVATMILSKRWRFIWTMMSELVYEDDDHNKEDDDDDDDDGKIGDVDDEESKKSVWGFLNKSMELHKSPLLELLTIKLGRRCPTDANISKWIQIAINRGLCKLYFKLRWLDQNPTRLPESVYTCKTLKHLALTHKILVDFPSSSCLPSLTKILLHYVVYKDEASLLNLLSSCPILKALFVLRSEEDDNVSNFTVKVSSLLVLWYDAVIPLTDEYEGTSLVVDTPVLTEFHMSNRPLDSFTIESLPCLEYACIRGNYVPVTGSVKFFKSLSNVLFLGLVLTDEMIVRCSKIKFPRVIKCKITPCESEYWMDSLLLLLNNTPKLQHFIVDYIYTYDHLPNASPSWMERSYEPVCLSTSLEKFKVLNCIGRVEEKEVVKYILANSKCLKKTTISFKSTFKHKDTMMEEFKAIPRVSIASHLLFKT